MGSRNRIERNNGRNCYSESDRNNNLYYYRNKCERLYQHGYRYSDSESAADSNGYRNKQLDLQYT
jgi:hypothetical protein